MEEDEELYNLSYKYNLPLIRLVTPTTDEIRLKILKMHLVLFIMFR